PPGLGRELPDGQPRLLHPGVHELGVLDADGHLRVAGAGFGMHLPERHLRQLPRHHALPIPRLHRRRGDALLPHRRGRADQREQHAPGRNRHALPLLAHGAIGDEGLMTADANIMGPTMTTSPPTTPQENTSSGEPRLGMAGRVAAWVVMIAAGLVVLGLVAITIGPRFLPYQALIVRSGSMSPTIPTGSIVFYTKIPS